MVSAIVSGVGVVIAAIVALYIAYLQRRQMRQIEAHRLDPSVPLKPPPAPLWQWVTRHISKILFAIAVLNLVFDLIDPSPLTRWAVFWIALSVALIFFALMSEIVRTVVDGYGEAFRTVTSTIGSSMQFVHEVSKVTVQNEQYIREITQALSGNAPPPNQSPESAPADETSSP